MRSSALRIAASAVAAVAVVAVVLVAVLGGRSKPANLREAITGQTYLSRSAAMFADPVRARIEVLVDRRRIDPSRVGFNPRFQPYVRVNIPRLTRQDAGPITRLVYTANLNCLTYECLTPGAAKRVQFPPAEVFYWQRSGGSRQTVQLPWFPLTVAARTGQADIANADPFRQPAWRASTEPLAISYGVAPGLLQALLYTVSGLLFLIGAGATVLFVRAWRGRLRRPATTPLERAVLLVESAAARDDSPDKRKALELLSRELTETGERELALAARELAWAEPTPIPASTQPLTLDVRRMIAERSNGHAR